MNLLGASVSFPGISGEDFVLARDETVFPSIFYVASILAGPSVGNPAYAFASIC
jgi:hypothetical protein